LDLAVEGKKARRSCRSALIRLRGGYRGSRKEFRQVVTNYWKPFGIKPKKMWFDLLCSREDTYDPRYIPDDLWWTKIYPFYNKVDFRQAYTDKCTFQRQFPWMKQPETIFYNSNRIYYNGMGQLITYPEAVRLLEQEPEFVIKPAIYSGEGRDILFHTKYESERAHQYEGKQPDTLVKFLSDEGEWLKLYDRDFIVQRIVRQHPVLAELHASSINTIRVISFLFGNSVHILSCILRMGRDGSRLDNINAGGLCCAILPDGHLKLPALDASGQQTCMHPNGRKLDDIQVPSFDKVIETVKKAHVNIPQFRIIGWDFAVDEFGEPVLIEYNGAPEMNQKTCGPAFGPLTEAVLAEVFLNQPQMDVIPDDLFFHPIKPVHEPEKMLSDFVNT